MPRKDFCNGIGQKQNSNGAPCPRPLFSQEQTLLRPLVTSEKCQEETSHAWLDCACVATSKCPGTWLTSAGRDKRKLLKIAGSCRIIWLLDGASLRSPHEDAGGIQ
jgi:hypothetical protein